MECENSNINYNCNNAVDAVIDSFSSQRICHGCKLPIEDEFSLHVSPNLDWHVSCLICCECHDFMDENCETCFIKDGRPYCRSDYIRLFGTQCKRCSEPINADTLVMRAKNQIFHVDCFCCTVCDKKLSTGEQFGMSDGKLYCKADFEALPMDSIEPTMEAELVESPETLLHNGCSQSIATSSPSTSSQTNSTITSTSKSSDKTRRCSTEQKQPRIRTVLTEQQLQTLRSVYQTNPRPDALLKEQLCELTGLSPRVIRVWFQNRRCKDKKALQKAEAARMQSGGKVLPMTPQTPITPDNMSQVSPHGGMQAFTYPLPAYEHITTPTLPPTPSNTCVSPIVSYQHNPPLWASPTDTVSPFDHAVDFSSPIPITTEHQSYIHSSASLQPHMQQPTTVTHFSF